MLLCKEQKREFIIEGKKIRVSDKIANLHWKLFTMPITEAEIMMYLRAENDGNPAQELISSNDSTTLSKLIESAIKQDLNTYFNINDAKKLWDSLPE